MAYKPRKAERERRLKPACKLKLAPHGWVSRRRLHDDFQSVISKMYTLRQRCFRLCMSQVMANVGEKSLPRLELFRPFQTLRHGRMGRMRFMTQGVEKQHVE